MITTLYNNKPNIQHIQLHTEWAANPSELDISIYTPNGREDYWDWKENYFAGAEWLRIKTIHNVWSLPIKVKGEKGDSNVTIGDTTTLEPGENALVVNTGTDIEPILEFSIPKGDTGEKGDKPEHEWDSTLLRFQNPDGSWGDYVNLKGEQGEAFTWNDFTEEQKASLKGIKGDRGEGLKIHYVGKDLDKRCLCLPKGDVNESHTSDCGQVVQGNVECDSCGEAVFYLAYDTNSIYVCTDSGWKWVGQIGGQDGEDAPELQIEYKDTNTGWLGTPSTFSTGNKWMKLSTDGGTTWSNAIKFVGDDAPETQAEFSTNGTSGWTSPYVEGTHHYIRFSTDGGVTWGDAIYIAAKELSKETEFSVIADRVILHRTGDTDETLLSNVETVNLSDIIAVEGNVDQIGAEATLSAYTSNADGFVYYALDTNKLYTLTSGSFDGGIVKTPINLVTSDVLSANTTYSFLLTYTTGKSQCFIKLITERN